MLLSAVRLVWAGAISLNSWLDAVKVHALGF